jgi:hypothetical protein
MKPAGAVLFLAALALPPLSRAGEKVEVELAPVAEKAIGTCEAKNFAKEVRRGLAKASRFRLAPEGSSAPIRLEILKCEKFDSQPRGTMSGTAAQSSMERSGRDSMAMQSGPNQFVVLHARVTARKPLVLISRSRVSNMADAATNLRNAVDDAIKDNPELLP